MIATKKMTGTSESYIITIKNNDSYLAFYLLEPVEFVAAKDVVENLLKSNNF